MTTENTKTEEQTNTSEQNTPLIINTQYLKDLSFESPNSPGIFVEMKHPPEVAVNLDVKAANINENLYRISLLISTEAKYEDKIAFICETEFCAVATINVPAEHLEAVLLVEVPKFLFPSARQIIADTTRNGGFAPLLLNPIDFMALYISKKQQQNANTPSTQDKKEDIEKK